jgi:hypothetical protein
MARFTRKDFLDALFQDYFREREGFIMVKSSRPLDLKTSVRYFPNVEILAKEPYQRDQHVFFGVCPREKMRAEKDYVHYLVALWAGLDLDPEGFCGRHTHFFGQAQAAKAVRSFPLPPSIVVESGRGVHLYWLLKDVTPVADVGAVELILARINGYFQCKTEIGIDSVLRLPDSFNPKVPAAPSECRVKYLNTDFRYDLAELEQLELGPAVSPTKSAAAPRPAEPMPHVAVEPQPEPPKRTFSTHSSGEALGEFLAHAGASREELSAPEAQTGTKGASVAVGPKRAASSASGSDFQPAPYGATGQKSAPSHELGSPGPVSEDILDRMADRLAERIAERIAPMLVDQIVEKVVQRLKPPR